MTPQEVKIANYLSELGLRWESQRQVGKYFVDFWIAEIGTVIDAAGVYGQFATKDKDYFKPEEGDVRIDSKKYVFRSFGMKRTEKETIDRIITCLVELRSLPDSFVDLDSNHQEKEIDV